MDCVICTEELLSDISDLECKHQVHWECIAKSGTSQCPICRLDITIPTQYQYLFEKSKKEKEARIQNQNEEASRELATQLSSSSSSRRRRNMILLGGRELEFNPLQVWNPEDLFIHMATINQSRQREQINVHQYTIDICNHMYELKALSIETGISFRDLVETMLNILDE